MITCIIRGLSDATNCLWHAFVSRCCYLDPLCSFVARFGYRLNCVLIFAGRECVVRRLHCVGQRLDYQTHWGWVTHICVTKITIIGSDNGLSPGRRLVIFWTMLEYCLTLRNKIQWNFLSRPQYVNLLTTMRLLSVCCSLLNLLNQVMYTCIQCMQS